MNNANGSHVSPTPLSKKRLQDSSRDDLIYIPAFNSVLASPLFL